MDREHVTPFIRSNQDFTCKNYYHFEDLSDNRWTVDDINDLKVVKNIINRFAPNLDFSWDKVLDLKKSNPELFLENMSSKRNEGLDLGTGQKLYKRAKQIIPGGTMLLSKRPEMFLPDHWPSYFSKLRL